MLQREPPVNLTDFIKTRSVDPSVMSVVYLSTVSVDDLSDSTQHDGGIGLCKNKFQRLHGSNFCGRCLDVTGYVIGPRCVSRTLTPI